MLSNERRLSKILKKGEVKLDGLRGAENYLLSSILRADPNASIDYLLAREQEISARRDRKMVRTAPLKEKADLLDRIIEKRVRNPVLFSDIDRLIAKDRKLRSKLSDAAQQKLLYGRGPGQELAANLMSMMDEKTNDIEAFEKAELRNRKSDTGGLIDIPFANPKEYYDALSNEQKGIYNAAPENEKGKVLT